MREPSDKARGYQWHPGNVCEQMMTGAGKSRDRCSRRFSAYVKSVLFHQDVNLFLYVSAASSHPQSASTCFYLSFNYTPHSLCTVVLDMAQNVTVSTAIL